MYVVHPQIKFACCTILLFGATCIRTVSSLCAGSQAINRNRWKPSENKGCVSYSYTHFEPFHSNDGYPWMPIAAPELQCQQNCPHPQILQQKKVSMSLRVLVVVLDNNTVALKSISSLNKCNYRQHSLDNSHHEVLCTPQELKEERTTQVGDAVPKFQEFPIGIYQETRKKCDYKTKETLATTGERQNRMWSHGNHKRKHSAIEL